MIRGVTSLMPLFSQGDPPIKDTRIEFDIVIAARGGALRAEQKIMVLREIFGPAAAAAVEKERGGLYYQQTSCKISCLHHHAWINHPFQGILIQSCPVSEHSDFPTHLLVIWDQGT